MWTPLNQMGGIILLTTVLKESIEIIYDIKALEQS
jgi:hypothetical protein